MSRIVIPNLRVNGLRQHHFGDEILNRANLYPTVDFQFAKNKSLQDSATGATFLVNFQRASNVATYVGADGLIKRSAVNLLLYSRSFDNPYWLQTNITTNAITGPDGKVTAATYEGTGTGIISVYNVTSAPVKAATQYTYSIYVKLGTMSASDYKFAVYDVSNSSFVGIDLVPNVTLTSTSWTRIVYSFTTPAGCTQIRVYPFRNSATIPLSTVHFWGAQLEEGTTATPYIRTTSTISGAPRFDHHPVTGESLGLLVEEARTNHLTWSEDFTNAVWQTTNPGEVTLITGVADPFGGTNATTLFRDSGAGDTGWLRRLSTATIGLSYTFSFWVRRRSGSGDFLAVVGDNISQTISGITSEWQRVSVSNVPTSTTLRTYFNVNSAGDEFDIFGAQLEEASFPTSYIPTEGSTVTRAADIASVEGADFASFYNATEGTVYAIASTPAIGTRGIVGIDDNTANERSELQTDGTDPEFVVIDGGAGSTLDTGTITAYTFFNLAGAYKHNDLAATVDGLTVQTATDTVPTVDRMRVGALQASGTYLNGHIKRLTYWPSRLSDPVLQLITS